MKILIFSDVHLDEYAISELKGKALDCDLVISAGDLSRFGNGLRRMHELLSTFGRKVLMVPGNNDPLNECIKYCEEFGLKCIHGSHIKINGYVFAGVGAGLNSSLHTPFEISEEDLREILSKFSGLKNLVLVSHCPPLGPMGEVYPGYNIGSESILKFINTEKPLMCITGHSHEHEGEELMIGETLVINPGKHGRVIELK